MHVALAQVGIIPTAKLRMIESLQDHSSFYKKKKMETEKVANKASVKSNKLRFAVAEAGHAAKVEARVTLKANTAWWKDPLRGPWPYCPLQTAII